jgi:hypothetical protein
MLHARKQDLLGMDCTTLYHSYLQEQSSVSVDEQWVEGKRCDKGKIGLAVSGRNYGALPTSEADESFTDVH